MSFAAPNNSAFLNSRRHGFDDEHGIYTRDEFQRDRDRIMHSRAFRRMMHKTQIFNANIGDHYRNRLTHTLEVSQIARSIGKNLSLNDELIEAIALGHDVGHTPFGHIGERTLHNIIMHGELNEIALIKQGFKHNFQSLRVLDELESRCNEYSGLNLTLAVREGILKHTSLKQDGVPVLYPGTNFDNIDLNKPSFTLEGQVVALADEIAQCTHDLEDAVRSKIITPDAIANDPFIKEIVEKYKITYDPRSKTPTYDTRSAVIKSMVGFFIEDACKTSQELVSHYVEKHSPQYTSADDCINEKCGRYRFRAGIHRNCWRTLYLREYHQKRHQRGTYIRQRY